MQPHKADTRIIPDFVDERRFYIREKEDPTAPFTFAAMGQLRPIKGHDTLIRAFARLRQKTDRPVQLRIAGAGSLREYLQGIIQKEGLEEVCHLVGNIPREQVVDFMNDCDCFVCSSRTEMLSCVLHECAACGRPAIATMCGGPQDILTDETGMLVPVDDVEAMADAMLTMLDKAPAYDRQAIRQHIIDKFGRDTVCGAILQACADAAGKDTP